MLAVQVSKPMCGRSKPLITGSVARRTFWPARQEAFADADTVRAQVVRPDLGDGRRRRHALRLLLHLQTMATVHILKEARARS